MSEFVVITPGTEVDLCEEMNHTSTVPDRPSIARQRA